MKLKVATEFSRTLGARYPREAKHSGEEFRQRLLLPRLREAMSKGERLEVDLDGTAGVGCGFMDEAFAGLIRVDGMSYGDVIKHLAFKSDEDPDNLTEISEYLRKASQ